MKLGSVILKTSIQNLSDANFHFYNSLVLTDDLAFQRTHFGITPPNIPRLYNHDAASDDNDDLPLLLEWGFHSVISILFFSDCL
jgi:hypothetical protein